MTHKKELQPEEQKVSMEELTQKLDESNKKMVKLPEITNELQSKIEYVIKELELLRKETSEKKSFIEEQMKIVDDKITGLIKEKKIKVNEAERTQSEQNIKHYIRLLDGVTQEIDHELSYFAQFLKQEKPTLVVVPKDAPEDFGVYIEDKAKWSRRYAKNIRKSTTISFSRYKFSFEEQLKKLNYMKNFLNAEA